MLTQKVIALELQLQQMQSAQVAYIVPISTSTNIGYSNPTYVPPVFHDTVPSVNQVTGIGAPDLTNINQPVQNVTPNCSLTGTRIVASDLTQSDMAYFTWTTENISNGTLGYLRHADRIVSGNPDFNYGYEQSGSNVISPNFKGYTVYAPSGETTLFKNSNSGNPNGFWRLDFNGTYCYATIK